MIEFFKQLGIAVLAFIPLITLLVGIHELGHFFAGKLFRTRIDVFSIGFGRAIAKRTDRSGVEWRIGWIPIGGYVRFAGDSNDASLPDGQDLDHLRDQIVAKFGPEAVGEFHAFKPLWQRAFIALAGPLANFVLAAALFATVLGVWGEPTSPPVVGAVFQGSVAEAAGIRAGDRIVSIDGRRMDSFTEVQREINLHAGDPLVFALNRQGQNLSVVATPRREQIFNEDTRVTAKMGRIGMSSGPGELKHYSPPQAVVRGTEMVGETISSTLTYLGRIFTGRENGDQISGVIGMASTTGKVAESSLNAAPGVLGWITLLMMMIQIAAFLSTGLGFANLLPIPILDGGHLMFYAYEAVARRPVSARVQEASFKVGLALVLGLMLFAAKNDLMNLQAFKFLGGLFS